MSEMPLILDPTSTWLLERWLEKFTGVMQSMTENTPSVQWTLGGDDELGDNVLIAEQHFTSNPEPMIWIGLPESVHQELGRCVLLAAGVNESDAEENRATCLEVVEQSLGGLVTAIGERVSQEISRAPLKQCPFFPNGLSVIRVTVAIGEKILAPLWLAFNPLLNSLLEAKPADRAVPPSTEPQQQQKTHEESGSSHRFDVLFDVALPVSVSFGKTELLVKDVLKLTTGSIVELNRSVSEPVDVIVNNCIIARGEVVVVDGNYGVRIINIVSRNERLRTGGAAVADSRSAVSAA